MANGFSIDVPGGGWQAANQGLSDIGAGLGQWARQQQQRQNELQDAITLFKMKSQIENEANPFSRVKENIGLAANLDQIGALTPELESVLLGGVPGYAPRGGFPTPGNFGNTPQFNPATMNKVDQFLSTGMPKGLSLTSKGQFGATQPFSANDYEMVATEFSASGRPKGFKKELTREAESRQKEEELKQKEIIQGVSGDIGGRLTLAKESIKNIDDIRKILFPGGTPESFKRTTAFASNLPLGALPIFPQRTWGKAEQDVFRKMGVALSGRQLIQTGVAARPEETSRLIAQFAPSVGSNPDAAWNALNELEDFYKSYITETDPEYRFGVKKFEAKQQNTTPAAKPSKQGSFSYLWE